MRGRLNRRAVIVATVALVAGACGTERWPTSMTPTTQPPDVSPVIQRPVTPSTRASSHDVARLAAACRPTIAKLGPPPRPASDLDVRHDLETENFPALPAPGFEYVPPSAITEYANTSEYVAYTPVDDPAMYAKLMRQDGFVDAVASGFARGGDRYGVEELRFRDGTAAADFNRRTLMIPCSRGSISEIHRVPGVADGVAFTQTDGLAPYRANVVIANVVIRMHICSCSTVPDLLGLVTRWASKVGDRYRSHRSAAVDELAGMLPASVPSGYGVQPDSVGNAGPIALARAVAPLVPAERVALARAGFLGGYARLWEGGYTNRQVVILYRFASAAGATAYLHATLPLFRASADFAPDYGGGTADRPQPFVVTAFRDAAGMRGTGNGMSMAEVRFTKGRFYVRAISVLQLDKDPVTPTIALAQAQANLLP